MLHIIKNRNSINSALRYSSKDDQFLLLEEAVYLVIDDSLLNNSSIANNIEQFFVLASDIQARGLQKKMKQNIQLLDYIDFVELTVKHAQSMTWA